MPGQLMRCRVCNIPTDGLESCLACDEAREAYRKGVGRSHRRRRRSITKPTLRDLLLKRLRASSAPTLVCTQDESGGRH
jgi:hypothetical protein